MLTPYFVIRVHLALWLLALIACHTSTGSQYAVSNGSRPFQVELTQSLDSLVESHRLRLSLPGISVAVGNLRSTTLYAGHSGYADLASRVPVSEVTRFRIYSVSKVFAAVVAHQLAEEGVLQLDAPVGGYVTNLPAWRDSVTVRHLLSHTSGLVDYADLSQYEQRVNAGGSDDADIDRALLAPLQFRPGTRWRYSNTGYALLQRIIEERTGSPLKEVIASRVIKPGALLMTSSDCETLATGYTPAWRVGLTGDSLVVATGRNAHKGNLAAGGLCSTPRDLARFFAQLVGGALVDSASWSHMLRREPHRALSGAGVFVVQDDEGFIVSHAGGGGNFNAEVMAFPNDSLILAAAANAGGADLEILLRAVRRRILRIPDPIIADLPLPREEIKQLIGVYPEVNGPSRIVIYEQQDSLRAFGGRLLKQPDGSYVPDAVRDLRLVFRYDNGVAQEITVLKYGAPQSHHRRQLAK